jgi:POT family proton-dependent oligopeptide transporter
MAEEEEPLLAHPGSPEMTAHVHDYDRFTRMMKCFGTAALFMLGALAVYLSGYRYLPARVERKAKSAAAPLTSKDWKVVRALISVMAVTVLAYIAYYQLANVLPVWIQAHADLNAGGFRIPIEWFYSIDPLASIVSVPFLFALWNHQARAGREPNALTKIAIGSFICGSAYFILVAAIALSPTRVFWLWPVLFCAVQGVGFMFFWPTLLALVSRAAPPKINATMMGVTFLTLFVANNLIGRIGAYYERMTPSAFWALHAAIGFGGGLLMLALARALGRILEPEPNLAAKR